MSVKLAFTPKEMQRKIAAQTEFECWVREIWIENESLKRENGAYKFPAIQYAFDGWQAGYEAGYRTAMVELLKGEGKK